MAVELIQTCVTTFSVGAGTPVGLRWKSTQPSPKGIPMQEVNAATRTDEFIKLMIAHQPALFGTSPLDSAENSKKVAQSLATLRAELIEQLKQQP